MQASPWCHGLASKTSSIRQNAWGVETAHADVLHTHAVLVTASHLRGAEHLQGCPAMTRDAVAERATRAGRQGLQPADGAPPRAASTHAPHQSPQSPGSGRRRRCSAAARGLAGPAAVRGAAAGRARAAGGTTRGRHALVLSPSRRAGAPCPARAPGPSLERVAVSAT
jgi:hypothetical protein